MATILSAAAAMTVDGASPPMPALVPAPEKLEQLGVNDRRRDTSASVQLGEWMPAQIQAENTTLDWDVTSHVRGAGHCRVRLDYTSGPHGITIASVALLEDGREAAQDVHEGFAGAKPRQPVYVLDLPVWKTDAHYVLQATVKGDGGTDSHGVVSCVFKPAQ